MNRMMPMVMWGLPAGTPRPGMAGTMAAHPRLVTQATATGELVNCPAGASPRYNRGDRMEVLRALRLAPDTIVYLVLLPNGCSGWIPATNVAFGQPMIGTGFGMDTTPMGTQPEAQTETQMDEGTPGSDMDSQADTEADSESETP